MRQLLGARLKPDSRSAKILRRVPDYLGIALFAGALWVLHHQLQSYTYGDVARSLAAIPELRIAVALLLSGVTYLLLTGYDALAFAYLDHHLPYGRILRASFTAYALSHNLSLTFLTSSAVRFRFYLAWKVPAARVAGVIAVCAVTSWVRFLAVGGAMLLALPAILAASRMPATLRQPLEARELALQLAGVLAVAAVAGYLLWSARGGTLRIAAHRLPLPSLQIALGQVGVSCLASVVPAAILYSLLPPSGLSFPLFLGLFLLAQFVGLLSHVPGGLGVFEAVLLLLLPTSFAGPATVAALLVYRAIYSAMPLGLAVLVLAAHEIQQRRRHIPSRRAIPPTPAWDRAPDPMEG